MRIIRYWPRAWVGDGGITNSVRRISTETVRAGAEVGVAVYDAPAPGGDGPFAWLPVRHAGRGPLRRPVGLAEHLDGADLLVLHSAWMLPNVHAAAVARRMGVPYVLEPRGAYDPCILQRRRVAKRAWWWALERRLVQHAAAVHIFFDAERPHLSALGYDGPAVVAPNGVSIPEGVAWDGGSGGYVLWIGRFDPEHKGLDLLLRGLRRLPTRERPALRLHGPDWAGGKARVARMVADLGLEEAVTIGAPVYGREKWDLIARAAAFAYPSRWEGFGNSTAEAVSVGVPTLVTPYPLGRWLASRGQAVLAEPTAEGLAAGLREVLSPCAARASRRATRDRLHAELTWSSVARSWLRQVEALR